MKQTKDIYLGVEREGDVAIKLYQRVNQNGAMDGLKRKVVQRKNCSSSSMGLNNSPYNIRCIFFDTETKPAEIIDKYKGRGKLHVERLYVGWLRFGNIFNGKFVCDKELEFRSIRKFWNFLEKIPFGAPVYLFAWNMDFDINIIDAYRQAARRDWNTAERPFMGDSVFAWHTMRPDGQKFNFYDGMNFCGGKIPLSKIGQSVGRKKHDIDRTDISKYPDNVISEYCLNDVKIVEDYMLRWFAFLEKHDCGSFKMTLAGQCMAAFRHKYPDTDSVIQRHNDKSLKQLERAAYHGGQVECFYIGKVDKVYKLDVNSFHPYIMSTKKLPYERVGRMRRNVSSKLLGDMKCFIADMTISCPDRLIPVKDKDRGLIFPVGVFRAQFTSVEYRRLLEIGGKVIKVHRLKVYKQQVLFKDYINEFYMEKKKYAEQGNIVFKDLAKYFMNSLEGKFGQKNDTYECYGDTSSENVNKSMMLIDGKIKYAVSFGGKTWYSVGEKESRIAFVPIPVFIRAWTRVILSEWMEIVKEVGGIVYYVDTDSMFVDEKGYNTLKEEGLINDFELGKLKLEANGRAEFINLKHYTISGVHKRKGISGRAEKKIVDEKEVFMQTKFLRTMGNVQYGISGGVGVIENFEVTPKGIYKKGVKTSNGWVAPIKLNL